MSKTSSKSQKTHLLAILHVLIIFSLLQTCKTTLYIPNLDLSLTTLDPTENGFSVSGSVNDDEVGFSVSSAGDINGDGYGDVIIGAYGKNSNKGAAYVIYGHPNFSSSYNSLDLTALDPATTGFIISGYAAGNQLGYSVRAAGNVNNDDYDDIIIGVPKLNSNTGGAYVIYGGSTATRIHIDLSVTTFTSAMGFGLTGEASGDYFGWAVSSAGDIDNDGYDDLIVGAPRKNGSQGAVYVIYGKAVSEMGVQVLAVASLDVTTTGFKITGNAAGDYFGASVSPAGNVNSDDYDDIILGAYAKNTYQGAVYVIYGAEKGSLGNIDLSPIDLESVSQGFTITGSAANAYFGKAVDSAGDVDQDGYDDIIIGGYGENSGHGIVHVIYGGESLSDIDFSSATLDPKTTGFTITDSAGGHLGCSARKAGDVNGDGYADIITGGDLRGATKGAAYVVYGGPKASRANIDFATTPFDYATTGFMVLGNAAQDHLGYSVSGAGDVNGDYYDDIIIGAKSKNNDQGTVYIVYSSCVTTDSTCQERMFCESCKEGFSLTNSECQICTANCQEFIGLTACQTCDLGYYFVSSTECASCPSNCQQCENSVSCQVCESGFFLYQQECFKPCPDTMFADSSDNTCKNCLPHCSSCLSEEVCQTCDDGYFLSNSLCAKQSSALKTVSKTLQGMSDTSNVLGSVISVGSSLFPVTKLVSKIVQNTRYIGLIVTDELNQVYQDWNTNLVSVDIPDAFASLGQFKPLPFEFARYDLNSAFLVNFWSNLVILGLILCIFIVSRTLKRFLERRRASGWKYALLERIVDGSLNLTLVQGYGCLDDVMFYFILDAETNPFKGGFSWMSFLCGLVFFCLGTWLILWNIVIVKRSQRAKNDKKALEKFYKTNKQWELFYGDFNDSDSWSRAFLAILAIRNCLSSFLIAALYSFPGIQTPLLMIIDGAIIIFLIAKKPLVEARTQYTQYFYEAIALLVHICTFVLGIQGDQVSTDSIWKIMFCKGIICLNYALTIGGFGFMLFEVYKATSPKIKAWRARQKQKKKSQENKVAQNKIALEEDSVNQSVLSTVKPMDLSMTTLNQPASQRQRQKWMKIRKVRAPQEHVGFALSFEQPSSLDKKENSLFGNN